MDELDRMLQALPREPIPPELAESVRLAVRRRHRLPQRPPDVRCGECSCASVRGFACSCA